MSPLHVAAHDRTGRGRRRAAASVTMTHKIYLLHGVGMWPGLFRSVAARFEHVHVVAGRPGYGGAPPVDDLDGQTTAVAELIAACGPGVVVGVSGGATVALAVAIAGVPGVEATVTHEPLVGPLVPALHDRVAAAGTALTVDPSPERIDAFLCGLYGDEWRSLPIAAREWVVDHRSTISREVAQFATFAPSDADLAGVAIPHLTTVGRRSGPERHEVASLLAGYGARSAVIEAAGHLAVVENSGGFASAVRSFFRQAGVR